MLKNVEFYMDRVIDQNTKVFVYFNLHKNIFSVKALEGEHRGKVVLHVEALTLKSVEFKVNTAGRLRVLKEKRKNVHAGAVGYLVNVGKSERDTFLEGEIQEVTYNPYKHVSFVFKNIGLETCKVVQCGKAYLVDKRVFIGNGFLTEDTLF